MIMCKIRFYDRTADVLKYLCACILFHPQSNLRSNSPLLSCKVGLRTAFPVYQGTKVPIQVIDEKARSKTHATPGSLFWCYLFRLIADKLSPGEISENLGQETRQIWKQPEAVVLSDRLFCFYTGSKIASSGNMEADTTFGNDSITTRARHVFHWIQQENGRRLNLRIWSVKWCSACSLVWNGHGGCAKRFASIG